MFDNVELYCGYYADCFVGIATICRVVWHFLMNVKSSVLKHLVFFRRVAFACKLGFLFENRENMKNLGNF